MLKHTFLQLKLKNVLGVEDIQNQDTLSQRKTKKKNTG